MAVLKPLYASYATIVITLASLATSATRIVGRQSTAVDNTTNRYADALVSGKISTGTGPTAGFIDIWVYAQHDNTPTYPDVITGSDAGASFTDENSRNSAMKLAAVISTDATANQIYWVAPFSVAALFGGVMPKRWGLFIAHSAVTALHATSSNHEFVYQGVNPESV